jgi:DNA modification methylase
MGSGMLPPCAYVTLEHEYILIFRKGNNRKFGSDEAARRRESAFFWEDRNSWYSDIWFDVQGVSQDVLDPETRKRSAAFPFELAYRLINMFSIMGDTVLDPFLGTGTTSLAAICGGRNSVGYEIDSGFFNVLTRRMKNLKEFQNTLVHERLCRHISFMKERESQGKEVKHYSERYHFPVITSQETEIFLPLINSIEFSGSSSIRVTYHPDGDSDLSGEKQ